jgi:hypothetical protein
MMNDEGYAERIRMARDCIHPLYTSYTVYCEFDEDCGKLIRYLPDDLEAASARWRCQSVPQAYGRVQYRRT